MEPLSHTSPLPGALLDELARFGDVVAVRDLVGGRGGRTFAVDHAGSDATTTVVHLRAGGRDALAREADSTRRAHGAGVGPEVLAVLPSCGALVTRWVPGAVLEAADLRDRDVLVQVAASVRALHDAPLAPPGAGSATAVPADPVLFRERYLVEARRRGVAWPADVVAEESRVDAVVRRLADGVVAPVGAHADLVPANLVLTPDRVVLLDHEYAGRADPAADLGGLAATGELDDAALGTLVEAYAGGAHPELLARVRDWRSVVGHAWYVWVGLGDDLGPERARWEAWAERVRAGWSVA